MKTQMRAFILLAGCSWLFLPQHNFGAPVSEQQASNAVLHAVAIDYPAASNSPSRVDGPFGPSRRTVQRVDRVEHNGELVGFAVSLGPSGYYLLRSDDELPLWKIRSDEGNFEALPPGFLSVLKLELAEEHQILDRLRKSTNALAPEYRNEWQSLLKSVSPIKDDPSPQPKTAGVSLTTTTWDQIAPYNYYCPTVGGGTPAGCTACAVSQILRYSTRPSTISGDHTDVNGGYTIHDAGGMGPYDWANMSNSITTGSPPTQRQAIGRLMYHVAVSLNSIFTPSFTAAQPADVPSVLQTYFSYSCRGLEQKSHFTSSSWYLKIAADIDAGRPIFYSLAQADGSGGHAAVCDGYRNGNEIHLNLGASGLGNNVWYNIDVIVPVDWNPQYTWTTHGAVFGITPPAPNTTSISPASLTASGASQRVTISGSNFDVSGNANASSLVFYDPGNNPHSATPINLTPTSMQCDITLPTAGQWKVKVVNGTLASSLFTFNVASVSAQLTGLSISGPASVNQNSSGWYTATAIFSDGSTPTVTPTWSLNIGAPASISTSGQLTASSVSANTWVTVTGSYMAGGVTKTASCNVLIVKTGTGSTQTTEVVVNGGVESGTTGWTLSGVTVSANGGFARSGSYFLWLGGAVSFNDSAYQTITIPSSATAATLSFYYNIHSLEGNTVAYDTFSATICNTSGTLLATVGNWSNINQDPAPGNPYYHQKTFNLLPYAGQTIRVCFASANNSTKVTNFRVDDVSVQVTVPITPTPVLFGVGGPTSVPEGSSAQYNAIVVYSDGSVQSVTPSWSFSGPGTISSSGFLNAESVSSDTAATVIGNYSGFPALNYYITIVNVAPVYTSLAISGPSSMNENSSAQFTAAAIYSDGTSQSASASWSVISGPGSVSSSGLLTIGEVSNNTTTTVSASCTIGGVTHSTTQQVTVLNVPTPPTLASLSISGPSSVNENSTAQYSATAWFSDSSSQGVIPTWSVDSVAASISIFGLLSAGEVANDTPVTVSASYTVGGFTRNAATNVTIKDVVQPTTLSAKISGNQILLTWPTNSAGFVVEYTTNFPPVGWTSNSTLPAIVNGKYTVTNATAGRMKFYRLKE